MARKATRSKRGRPRNQNTVVVSSGNTLVKDLIPKDSDLSYLGAEPNFTVQPSPDQRSITMIKVYNWYSHFYGNAEAKEFLIRYLESIKSDKVKLVRKVPDSRMIPTAGWMARAALRGLALDTRQTEFLNNAVDKLVLHAKSIKEESEASDMPTQANRANVQEVMRERASEAAGEVDHMFDQFLTDGCPKNVDVEKKIVEELESRKILTQHVPALMKRWQRILAEYNEVLTTKDEQLKEGYTAYSKSQMKAQIAFAEQVIAALNGYVSLKQATKKVRVRKPVPVEKIVARLKHAKAFKDASQKLDLTGLSPAKLHGASEAWVYDVKRRKMHHYVADTYGKTLAVKGNTLLGFDKNESKIKTLRKPAEQIKELVGSKPAARKYFDQIKAVAVTPKGRFSKDMIILRAF